mmetsp:Transcript_295/g.765  ORF Transcript_295/g.765 Transcript_295/m.765 type:complete len:225 (+) Transcript_295:82-756(+)
MSEAGDATLAIDGVSPAAAAAEAHGGSAAPISAQKQQASSSRRPSDEERPDETKADNKESQSWEPSREYPIILGPSFESADAAVSTYRYENLPPSVDARAPYVADVASDGTAQVERPHAEGFEGGPARFSGQVAPGQPGDFALVFKGDHFVLEKVATVATNLRHDDSSRRAPPAKRKRASNAPRQSGRPASPLAAPTLATVSRVSKPAPEAPTGGDRGGGGGGV